MEAPTSNQLLHHLVWGILPTLTRAPKAEMRFLLEAASWDLTKACWPLRLKRCLSLSLSLSLKSNLMIPGV